MEALHAGNVLRNLAKQAASQSVCFDLFYAQECGVTKPQFWGVSILVEAEWIVGLCMLTDVRSGRGRISFKCRLSWCLSFSQNIWKTFQSPSELLLHRHYQGIVRRHCSLSI